MDTKLPLMTAATLIGLFNSVVYLEFFWTPFGVEIFQFAGMTDFPKLAIYPLGLSALFFVLYLACIHMLTILIGRGLSDNLEPGSGDSVIVSPKTGVSLPGRPRVPRRKDLALVALVFILTAGILVYYMHFSLNWGALLVFAALAMFFEEQPYVIRYLPDRWLRRYSLLVIGALPMGLVQHPGNTFK
ncbi:hypothetical protein BG58_18025 [Caballeronia jiangsuensis]|nr:hypothetical protein BG58_18025 [Caballeronia jiangsuensis]